VGQQGALAIEIYKFWIKVYSPQFLLDAATALVSKLFQYTVTLGITVKKNVLQYSKSFHILFFSEY
jgi:hypothetical protein